MTTQREPDTSAEGGAPLVSKLYNALAHLLDLYDREDAPTPEHAVALDAARQVIALADAAGQAAPVPPPVEGLETTAEERAEWLSMLPAWPDNIPAISKDGAMRLLRDFDKVHDRAEGLAKEVGRLKAGARQSYDWYVEFRERALAAEAKLAVYEAPVADGEVEKLRQQCDDAIGALDKEVSDQHRSHHGDPPNDAEYTVSFVALAKVEKTLNAVYFALGRLSRDKAEAVAAHDAMAVRVDGLVGDADAWRVAAQRSEGRAVEAEAREAKLREALTAAADNHNKLADEAARRFHEWHTSACHRAAAAALLGVADAFARAAFASSSPTKEKSDPASSALATASEEKGR